MLLGHNSTLIKKLLCGGTTVSRLFDASTFGVIAPLLLHGGISFSLLKKQSSQRTCPNNK